MLNPSVRTLVDHLADCGALRAGADPLRATDACWALTGTPLFTKLTVETGWDGACGARELGQGL
jgi:hypothetical protein